MLSRAREREAVDRLLAAAREGSSEALVLSGEPGIGKTTLLEYAIGSAKEMRVVRVTATQSELEIPFASVHQLLEPLLDGIDDLPDPQRDALASTFGLVGGLSSNRLLFGLAVVTLLSNAGEERGLLCVVDDAHWLDRESAETLAFVTRRLGADAVAVLFAARALDAPGPLDEVPHLDIERLSAEASDELVSTSAGGLVADEVMERVVSETAGNPLAIIELAAELTPTQLTGGSVLPDPLPLPPAGRLRESFLLEVRRLPAATQTVLLLVAAEPGCDADLFWRAIAELGIASAAAAPAEARKLLSIGRRVRFPHPVIRAVVYGAATADERRRVHLALAATVDHERHPGRAAWHRAAASMGLDEGVAQELEYAARDAPTREGYATSAMLLERAADLSPDPRRRAERLLSAAAALLTAGATARASIVLDELTPQLTDQLQRVRAAGMRGAIARESGSMVDAPPKMLEAAQALEPIDMRLARDAYLDALVVALYAGPFGSGGGVPEAARAARAAPAPPPSQATVGDLLLDGFAMLYLEGHASAEPTLRKAIVKLQGTEDIRWLGAGCYAASELWDDEALHTLGVRWIQGARNTNALASLAFALTYFGAICEVLSGRFDAAEAYIAEARELFGTMSGSVDRTSGSRLSVAAWRGREPDARNLAEASMRQAVDRGLGGQASFTSYALAVLELGLGRYEAGLTAAQRATEYESIYAHTMALPEVVEAAMRTGNKSLATEAVERLAARTIPSGTDWGLGMLARSRALSSPNGDADALYREAIARLQQCRARPHLARARLLYGEWLRRQRRRSEAREELRSAHAMFVAMDAEAFAERARTELLAAGEHVRPREADTRSTLTPHESRVAVLVSEGLSNPEIAARLFVSPRTVEYHLGKIFRKLEINSRAELAARTSRWGARLG